MTSTTKPDVFRHFGRISPAGGKKTLVRNIGATWAIGLDTTGLIFDTIGQV